MHAADNGSSRLRWSLAASSFSSSRVQVRQVRMVICWKIGIAMSFWMRVFVAVAATREK